MNKDWFKEIEYTPEVLLELRKNAGYGYIIGDQALINFDKAVRREFKK